MAGFLVVGEAVLDLGPAQHGAWLARPGGSPYNVAIGLARLGRATRFAGRLSTDPLGRILREHALASGIDLSLCVDAPEPSTVALVALVDGVADYEIGVVGTADFAWTDAELARLPAATIVHFGSLASWLSPAHTRIHERIKQLRDAGSVISYDPNVRPALLSNARERVETCVRLAHVVKASADDLAWLYPHKKAEQVGKEWLEQGPSLVVITLGADGSLGCTRTAQVRRPAQQVNVVDMVGAGDAFTSGLLDALADDRPLTDEASLAKVLDHAGLVAAITCDRAGADPPRRNELAAYAQSRLAP